MHDFTVFLDTPYRDSGDPYYWIQVKASNVASAKTKARNQACEDLRGLGKPCEANDEDFPFVMIIYGWPKFRCRGGSGTRGPLIPPKPYKFVG